MELRTPIVRLTYHTPDAIELLIYTKSTRLQGKQTIDEIKAWPYEKKLEELAYMRDTIKSSWEFVDYIFEIHGVSREFTHQFVRTRDMTGIDDPAFGEPDANFGVVSFAQESQRTVDASGNGFVLPTTLAAENREWFELKLDDSNRVYAEALSRGEPPQNARALLPTAVSTSIIVKASLRTLHHMAEVRLCTRTQGQYQDVFRLMRTAVYDVHPWAKGWIEVFCVNNGTCCFPRYNKCPIQGPLFNPETGLRFDRKINAELKPNSEKFWDPEDTDVPTQLKNPYAPARPAKRAEIFKMWEEIRHEARPVAVGGKTM